MTMNFSGTTGLTFPDNTTQNTAASGFGFKNRIINGAMMIDQRNAGASVTAGNGYTLDRFVVRTDTGTSNTVQQSSTAPTGFKNSLIVTVGTGAAPASNGRNYVQQPIEGLNVSDLAWGTASAATVTLSFWVRCSLTGTFGGAIQNAASDRSYPFTYTISAANTFEYKTITVAGDQSGTWLTTNGVGLILYVGLGCGSTFNGTAGSWAAADYRSATGSTNVVATSGATFYITGVQLEKGSAATGFDYRPYGTELSLCQRYYETNCPVNTAPANGTSGLTSRNLMAAYDTGIIAATFTFLVTKRATPTIAFYSGSDPVGAGAGLWSFYNGSWVASTTTSAGGAVPSRFDVNLSKSASFSVASTYITQGVWAASAEL